MEGVIDYLGKEGTQEIIKEIKKLKSSSGNNNSSENQISPIPKQNEIIYTTIDGEKIEFDESDFIISNKYFSNLGFGKLTFSEDLTDNLPDEFFYNKITLKSVILPEGITILPAKCFSWCSNLEIVELPNSINSFGSLGNQFHYCFRLKEINLPNNITEIPVCCFYNCSSLNHIYLHDNITKIGNSAFEYSGISNIDLNKVTEIEDNAFAYSQLISLDTKNVKTIGVRAFSWCKDLVTVFFNSSLNSLGSYCFNQCSSLSNINFIENLNLHEIPSYCFNYCYSLNEISIDYNITTLGFNAFYYCPLRSITIHSSSITNYNNAFMFDGSRPTLEYFYTKSAAPINTMNSYLTLKTVVLDTPSFLSSIPNLSNLRNYCTIYVQEHLLEQYRTTYPGYYNLFKPITGDILGSKVWSGTEEEYELLDSYDINTIYYIFEEDEEI